MAFRLRRGRAIGSELKQLYDAQLGAALESLAAAANCDMHAVRKHIKKARALAYAATTAGATVSGDAERALKIANRSLGVLADAHRIVEIIERLRGFDRARLPDAMVDRIRGLLAARAANFDDIAARDGTRVKAARLVLFAKIASIGGRHASLDGAALALVLRDAHHQARQSRRVTRREPTVDAFHRWRRHVKREWYLFRLIADHTGDRLRDDRHRLAALDACLGELHDLNVLAAILDEESILSRRDTAAALRTLRAATRDLRRRAELLSVVLNDHARDVSARVEVLWGAAAAAPAMEAAWPASA
jgi:CHAD domain-containing protein